MAQRQGITNGTGGGQSSIPSPVQCVIASSLFRRFSALTATQPVHFLAPFSVDSNTAHLTAPSPDSAESGYRGLKNCLSFSKLWVREEVVGGQHRVRVQIPQAMGQKILYMDEDDDRLQTEFECDDCGETVATEDNNPPFNCPHYGGEQGFTAV